MRYATLIGLTGLLLAQAPAPVGGDACGYRWYTSASNVPDSTPTFAWVNPSDLNNGNPDTVRGMGDDNHSPPIQLPFNFVFYWHSYNTIYIGSNGYITFRRPWQVASGPAPYFPRFPSSALPNDWIAPYLADLTFTDEAGAPVPSARLLYGTDAQGRFVIIWDSVPYWNDASPGHWQGRNSFQLILDPRDSSITIQYKQITAGYDATYSNGNFNVVGMENITGQFGLDIAAAWPVPIQNFAIRIYHPRTFTCNLRDIQADWTLNERGEGLILIRNGAVPQLQAGVFVSGNQVITNNIRSALRITPVPAAQDILRDTVFFTPPAGGFPSGTALTAAYTRTLNTDRPPNTPLSTSRYSAQQIVSLIGIPDGYGGNNTYVTELVICDSLTSGPRQGRYILRYDDGNWDNVNEGLGGIAFANGMTFVAPQDIIVEALSVDMIHQVGGSNNYPLALWVYEYDPQTGAVGAKLDSVGLDVTDFPSGELIRTLPGQSATFELRRYTVPLTSPINLSAGQGVAVGFLTLAPASATSIGNFVVDDQAPPISRRALEGIAGIWAPYRDAEGVDFAVGLIARLDPTSSTTSAPRPPVWEADLFPNPASDAAYLRIVLPERSIVSIRIVDLQGREVWAEQREVPAGGYKLRLPTHLATGTYFVGVTYQGYTKGFRLVVQ